MKSQWKKEFRLLLKRSVVTGIPELLATRNNCRRFLRSCVLCFCLAGFSYYTYLFLKAYWKYPTTMDVVIDTPEMVEIPAITFCSYNGITASTFCSMNPELCSPQRNYSKFCQENNYFYCDQNYIIDSNDTIPAITPFELPNLSREEFRKLGNLPEDLMDSCYITDASGSTACRNKTKWISVFDTMGLPNNCYSLNSLIGDPKGSTSTLKAKSQIRLKIKTLTQDTFYTSTPTAIQMSVHHPRATLNPFKKGFAIKPCYSYFVYVSKIVNRLLAYPYKTNCQDYMSLWKSRGGHGPLSKTQCREECLLNVSLLEMKCVDPYFVAYPNTAKICSVPASTSRIFNHCNRGCLRACHREDVSVEVEEHASLLAKDNMGATKKCLSIIVIAFNRMEVKTFSYYPKYETIELFGYIGGFLGVWLGVSLLAITDVLETIYLTIKALRSCRRKRNMRKSLANKLMFDPYYDKNEVQRRIIKIL